MGANHYMRCKKEQLESQEDKELLSQKIESVTAEVVAVLKSNNLTFGEASFVLEEAKRALYELSL